MSRTSKNARAEHPKIFISNSRHMLPPAVDFLQMSPHVTSQPHFHWS